MRIMMLGGAVALAMLASACTTRGDVRNARQNLREAQAYGDRRDVRDARRDLRRTRSDYRNDNQCGPRYGRRC